MCRTVISVPRFSEQCWPQQSLRRQKAKRGCAGKTVGKTTTSTTPNVSSSAIIGQIYRSRIELVGTGFRAPIYVQRSRYLCRGSMRLSSPRMSQQLPGAPRGGMAWHGMAGSMRYGTRILRPTLAVFVSVWLMAVGLSKAPRSTRQGYPAAASRLNPETFWSHHTHHGQPSQPIVHVDCTIDPLCSLACYLGPWAFALISRRLPAHLPALHKPERLPLLPSSSLLRLKCPPSIPPTPPLHHRISANRSK
jgi:hypothetical protein